MRRFASAFFLGFILTAPAAAQFMGKPPREPAPRADPFIARGWLPAPSVGREVRDIRDKVDVGRDTGALTKQEARRLNREARQIRRLARRYGRDGLSPWERAELEARMRYLRDAVQVASVNAKRK